VSPRQRRAPISLQTALDAAQAVAPVQDRIVYEVPVTDIAVTDRNPRKGLPDIDDLAASIDDLSLLQPIVVRRVKEESPTTKPYELVAGHRRFAAIQKLKWANVPAMVRDEDAEKARITMLVENLQRVDLKPAEEAAALRDLMFERKWSLRRVAREIHRTHGLLSKRLRVFDDERALAPFVLHEQLPVSTAEELIPVTDDNARKQLAQQAIDERWGQVQTRETVREWLVTNQGDAVSQPEPARVAARQRPRSLVLVDELDALVTAKLPKSERNELAERLRDILSRLV
jgi:ParB family chromosome partitioning protein